jgi:hypothetical protein
MEDMESLRYPIGRFAPPPDTTPEIRFAQIETLRSLPEMLQSAVNGLRLPQLDTPYREGGWTVRQLVHHVADSHANAYVRCKLALTEDWPTVKTYDEKAWAELADSRDIPIGVSLLLIGALHTRWVALLESLSEADFQKGYNHPELGRQTLDKVIALYAWHSRHHTAHITNLRARQNW